jgi:glycosyltransferase involved in cell wall biosynthesis
MVMEYSDLVVFGEDWGRHPSSTQHLITQLQQHHKVLWVNSIGMRRPRLNRRDMLRAVDKCRAMLSSSVTDITDPGSPTLLSPRAIPWPANPLARWINRYMLAHDVKAAMRKLSMRRPILWTSLPTAVDVLGNINERASVYYCGDDFSALAGVDHQAVAAMEEELVHKVDMVVAASPVLAQRFPSNKTVLLPHGVDTTHFSRHSGRPSDLPKGRPIVGFYGSISNWMDVDLLRQVSIELGDWNVVLIGPIQTDVSSLAGLSNVHFLGEKSHKELPSYVHHWQVSMLPFRDNAQIRACNPLKLREYLAAGKPVVTTDFPALDGYRDVVSIASGAEQFAKAVRYACMDGITPGLDSVQDIQQWRDVEKLSTLDRRRRQRVEAESWEARSEALTSLLASL